MAQIDDAFFEITDSLYNNYETPFAIELLEEARPKYEANNDWPNYFKTLERNARYLDESQDTQNRLILIEQILSEGEHLLPIDHIILGNALQQKGECYFIQGQIDSTFYYLEAARENYRKNEDYENISWTLIYQSVYHYYLKEFSKMTDPLNQVLDILDQHPDLDPEIANFTFQTLSVAHRQTGAYKNALAAAKKALDFSLAKPKYTRQDSIELADRYNNLGVMHADRQDYIQAIQNYKVALNIQNKINASAEKILRLYNNIGSNFIQMGKYADAEEQFMLSKALCTKFPDQIPREKVIITDIFLASTLKELGKSDVSIQILKQIQAEVQENQIELDWFYYNLGRAYQGIGNYTLAIENFEKSGVLFLGNHSFTNYDYTRNQRRMADALIADNNNELAIKTLQDALIYFDNAFENKDPFTNPTLNTLTAYSELLPLLQSKGKALQNLYYNQPETLAKVIQTYELADATIDSIRNNQLSPTSKLILSTYAQEVYSDAVDLFYELYAHNNQDEHLHNAFHFMEKSKSLLLLEGIREHNAIQSTLQQYSEGDAQFQDLYDKEQQLKIDQVFLERKLKEAQQENDSLKIETINSTLAGIYQDLSSLRQLFEKDFPAYSNVSFNHNIASVDEVREHLVQSNSDAVLIEYFWGVNAIYAIQINTESTKLIKLKTPAVEVEALIDQYRLALAGFRLNNGQNESGYQSYLQSAHQLYWSLFAEIMEGTPVDKDRLIIIPDGKLGYISFESLISKMPESKEISYSLSNQEYLIKNWIISYGYSSTLLLENQNGPQKGVASQSYVGFAPIFDQDANPIAEDRSCEEGTPLGALIHSEASVSELQALLGGAKYLRTDASKANFLNALANYKILHLSTHACVDDLDPQFNRIFFANEDLPTYEIYNLDLNADLVVLSACETGFGELVKGEGIMSLARSFMYAGSPSVVTSLWNANDYATTQIMIEFHKNLKKGLSKDRALHQAKLTYLDAAPSRLAAPFLWSNFILIGNAEPIELQSNMLWLWGLIGVIVVIFGYWIVRKKRKV